MTVDLTAFCALLEQRTGITAPPDPTARLREDLHWDSLTFCELAAALDEAGGCVSDEWLASGLITVADLQAVAAPILAAAPGERLQRTPRVILRPVAPRDTDWLYALHTHPDHLTTYRLRGRTPDVSSFLRFINDGAACQFVAENEHGTACGHVALVDWDQRSRFAHVVAIGDPQMKATGLLPDAVIALCTYAFDQFDLRKLYAHCLEPNYQQFASGAGRLFTIEGRLTEHEYVNGCWVDLVILAVTRQQWNRTRRRPSGTLQALVGS